MKLIGAFGQAVNAEIMYVPLGQPCPLGNATQRVPLLCAVTPELATSADLLLTPDDYQSLRHAAYESEDDLEGGECGLVEGLPEQEGTLARENGVESAVHTSADDAPPLEDSEESNKGVKGDARCEVNVGQGKEIEGDENRESKERDEFEPLLENREDMLWAKKVEDSVQHHFFCEQCKCIMNEHDDSAQCSNFRWVKAVRALKDEGSFFVILNLKTQLKFVIDQTKEELHDNPDALQQPSTKIDDITRVQCYERLREEQDLAPDDLTLTINKESCLEVIPRRQSGLCNSL
ncbi:hypothetical protein MTO96_007631 [Rhipicephalus appendiculatus]